MPSILTGAAAVPTGPDEERQTRPVERAPRCQELSRLFQREGTMDRTIPRAREGLPMGDKGPGSKSGAKKPKGGSKAGDKRKTT